MKSIILGTAGHIDHGKTTLVKALTGVETDRLEEERRRGISIELGFARLDVGDVRFGIVDVRAVASRTGPLLVACTNHTEADRAVDPHGLPPCLRLGPCRDLDQLLGRSP